MRILFLTRLYWPHVGGVEKHVEEIAKRLKLSKAWPYRLKAKSIKILTTRYDKSLKTREKRNGIEIIRFEQPMIKFLGLLYTWLWILKNIDLINKSDIIHIHDVFIWYLPFKFLFPSKPVFITFHGRWGKYPIPLVDVIQKRLGAKLSNGVISIGEYIPKNYGFKSDITLYGAVNIIENSKFHIQNDNSKSKIIYVGRLDEDTGLSVILDALKYCRRLDDRNELEVEFIGDGELRKECEKYGKVYGFTDPTTFYRKAKFCFASGYLTIHEAMAHKCLVFAAYKHLLHRDYYKLTPFSKFIFISDNPQKIAERIKYLNKNQKAAQKIIEEGYNWVKTQTWEKLANEYLHLWGIK